MWRVLYYTVSLFTIVERCVKKYILQQAQASCSKLWKKVFANCPVENFNSNSSLKKWLLIFSCPAISNLLHHLAIFCLRILFICISLILPFPDRVISSLLPSKVTALNMGKIPADIRSGMSIYFFLAVSRTGVSLSASVCFTLNQTRTFCLQLLQFSCSAANGIIPDKNGKM